MAELKLTIPDNVIVEINTYAKRKGFSNGKELIHNYLKECVGNQRRRQLPVINLDDVTID